MLNTGAKRLFSGRLLLSSKAVALLVLLGSISVGPVIGRPIQKKSSDSVDQQEPQDYYHQAFPIVEPDETHTKLQVAKEGLEVISRIKEPLGVVAVIGPYRSGKSFLLNQLLSLPCSEGFGVGHMRDTKTKGIWVWGEPVMVPHGNSTRAVIYLDTEGFESIGKSNVYDDRIFALAAIVSSLLIYNLPETVREADIGKLSFAVELAEEFYGRVRGREAPFVPAKLLWLIQRDFLQGKSVQQMVDQALEPVPNSHGDHEIEDLNRVRTSLTAMATNSSAFGLMQPHLERTRLCELPDDALAPGYVEQRERLKVLVEGLVGLKTVHGRPMTGPDFVGLLKQTLDALNQGEFPSASSVVESFNRAVLERSVALYKEQMGRLPIPTAEAALEAAHTRAAEAARGLFETERFGGRSGPEAYKALDTELETAHESLLQRNRYESMAGCEAARTRCEDDAERLVSMRLPSLRKFDAGVERCNGTHTTACDGPSLGPSLERLTKMWSRERAQFIKDYNSRLFNWLVMFSLGMVAVSRFVLKWTVLEVGFWGVFIFLEAYTRLLLSPEKLYQNPYWRSFVNGWEVIVYNPVLDLDRFFIPLLWLMGAVTVWWRCFKKRRPPNGANRRPNSPAPRRAS